MKVSDFTRDSHDPRGSLGIDVDQEIARGIAQVMREAIAPVAKWVYETGMDLKTDEYVAAWEYLNAIERTAWKELERLGKANAGK